MRRIAAFTFVLALAASTAFANEVQRKDLQVFNDISKSVNRYTRFTIFDDVNVQVDNGVVVLTGKVTMPYKRDDLAKRVAKVDGVVEVDNRIEVLPVSFFDNELRARIARAIYRNPSYVNLATHVNPPVHIIVDRGHVTLTGVVLSNVDRMHIQSLATGFGAFSITNKLRTEAEAKAELESLN